MCEYISWIPKTKGNYFLTYHQIHETTKGKEVLEKTKGDWRGHEAINLFYGLSNTGRLHKECTDFSTPNNFPPDIVQAIKNGEMRGVFSIDILTMLSPKGKKEYENKCYAYVKWSKAYVKWSKAYAKLSKARAERDKYLVKWSKTRAEWSKADAELSKACAERDKARAERDKYLVKWSKADAELSIFWEVYSKSLNRIRVWR